MTAATAHDKNTPGRTQEPQFSTRYTKNNRNRRNPLKTNHGGDF
jgi:hypothetical protein